MARTLPSPLDVPIGDDIVGVEVRESVRSRRMRIVIRPARAPEVVVPVGASQRQVARFVHSHRGWIGERLAEARRATSESHLALAGVVWLGGAALPVVHVAGEPRVRRRDGIVEVSGSQAAATAAVERWYRREARAQVAQLVTREACALGVEPVSVSIRDQRTRWGSCSARRTLSFSWRLVLAPFDVLEYVAVHELCHLIRPDHSPAFWRLVGDRRPTWRDEAGWLRLHGHALQLYDPSVAVR